MAGVTPINIGLATGDHRLLHIRPIHEQLPDGPAIAVGGDPAKDDGPSDHHPAKVITGTPGPFWLSPRPIELGSVNAGQPDPFTRIGSAGVAVVAAQAATAGQQSCSLRIEVSSILPLV